MPTLTAVAAYLVLAALAMDIDPAFATTHHGLRLLLVVFLVPVVLPYWRRRTERAAGKGI